MQLKLKDAEIARLQIESTHLREKKLEAEVDRLEEKCKDYAGTLHSKNQKILELEGELEILKKRDYADYIHINDYNAKISELEARLKGRE